MNPGNHNSHKLENQYLRYMTIRLKEGFRGPGGSGKHHEVVGQLQYYWGALCLCSRFHPLKLASNDPAEAAPTVKEFIIMCPVTLKDVRFELFEVVKYRGPLDDNFRTHPLFL